jgi:cytochrome c oxidase cbb3-type subunit 4
MSSTYEFLATFAQSAGLVYCVALFLGVVIYALWPKNGEAFNKAAESPLRED